MSHRVPSLPRTRLAIALMLAATAATYVVTGQVNADDPALAAAPPAPQVEVATLEPVEIRSWNEFSGRLSPVDSAAIKPLVSGTIQQVLFEEGQWVEAGSPLFVIDPRPHEAALAAAEAQLVTAQSRAQLAKDEFERAEQLLASKLLSQSLYDSAASTLRVAQAEVREAESAVSQARLNLEYAHVSAPVSGRISRAELTVGNVVEAGPNAPVLTTIVADDRFYAEFNVSEPLYIELVRAAQDPQEMPVELTLANDGRRYLGHIHSFDNQLDTRSGTIRARALVANSDGALTAGMYATVRVSAAQTMEALLIPERAIGTNQSHKFVYVVDNDNVAQYRQVTLGGQHEGQRIVVDGVVPGDDVIVNGLARVMPNSPVDPVPATDAPSVAAR
ncbi:MAG: efflux RND transporter periplasmic adaptor subunit [Pseudomonadota bacterium]|nr:efflux RND transporter periplasmic adaptor subunit [Pseudomonadota bacterium]